MAAAPTLNSLLDHAGGRPSGFDYLRSILALLVLVIHALLLGGGRELTSVVFWQVPGPDALLLAILPMFFALSGFLVAGSLYRCRTLVSFLGLRFLRIYPALTVEVLLTAFLLGPFITTLAPGDYFSSPGFLRYVMNVTGHTTVYLPGAFPDNPLPHVANGQLWTVPWELACYIALSLAAIIGGRRSRGLLVLGLAVVMAAALVHHGLRTDWQFPPRNGALAGPLLVAAFMAGVVLHAYKEHLPAGAPWLMGAALVAALLLSFTTLGQYPAVLLTAYVTCAIGVRNPPRIAFLRHADLSYGVFLYHFIVQQTLMFAFPALQTWYWCLIVSLPLTLAVAAASWYFVEQPVLARKQAVFRLEQRVQRLLAALPGRGSRAKVG